MHLLQVLHEVCFDSMQESKALALGKASLVQGQVANAILNYVAEPAHVEVRVVMGRQAVTHSPKVVPGIVDAHTQGRVVVQLADDLASLRWRGLLHACVSSISAQQGMPYMLPQRGQIVPT